MDIPIWVLLLVGGIIISAFMAVKTGRDERKQEHELIEREGEVYIQRLEKEREERMEKRSFG
ncbi:sporulation YhaL family protein [Robertmurraya andreesenii]|uniref:SigE-dependent sporulation protein n=1 Tax=Anoxybacillus andreesenii TaxID=1325932 RepID=A0ABT9UYH5_9BACL|nr:sporulation YhaL family protein [Robertmurraya andreesenii]MDQ0153745.1 hypothetical protein [Robertmurraya andreesenii]